MKLIMENFRKFVLKERKSDEVYMKTARFLADTMTLENYYNHTLKPETVPVQEASKPFDLKKFIKDLENKYTPLQRKFLHVTSDDEQNWEHDNHLFQIRRDRIKDLWKQYIKIVKSTIIFRDFLHFEKRMESIRIYATHSSSENLGGSMDSHGTMTLYLGDKINDKTSKEILSYIKEEAYGIIIHEGTHWFNAIRADGEGKRSAGGKKQHDAEAGKFGASAQRQAYHDSTEELQARLIDSFTDFNSTPWDDTYLNSGDPSKEEVYVQLSSKDVQRAIIQFLDTFYYEALSRQDWKKHNEDYKQKLFGRVYQFLKKAMKSEDFKKWANQAEEKGTIIPRSEDKS